MTSEHYYLLDTNIISYLMRGKGQVAERLRSVGPGRVAISVITAIELREGAVLDADPDRRHATIDVLLTHIPVLPLPIEVAGVAGRIRALLRQAGKRIGEMDTLIAAHALQEGRILVTNNTAEFRRVPGLRIENWT